MDGQIAGDHQLTRTRGFHAFGYEGDRRKLGDIEEVVTPQVFVSHFYPAIHGTGVDGHIHGSLAEVW